MLETNSPENPSRRKASTQARFPTLPVIALCIACAGWGLGFPVIKWGQAAVSSEVPGAGAASITAGYTAVRFLLASLLYALLVIPHLRGFSRQELLGGAVVGSTFSVGLFLQLWGLQFTTPSAAAFLTSLVVVFTPIAQAVIQRRSPSRRTWLAVGIALVGIYILTNPSGGGFGFGELLNLLSALAFTGQILTLDHYGRGSDPRRLTTSMFITTALLNLVCFTFLMGSMSTWAAGTAAVAGNWTVQWTMAVTVVACTLIAFGLMNKYQPKIAPASAALIYCMEPVFASLFSVMLGAEPFTARLFLGGAVILAADALDLTGRADRK